MPVSTMSEDFHDWLEKCPCNWFRISNNDNSATYEFIEESKD